jgi:hypothetical protein
MRMSNQYEGMAVWIKTVAVEASVPTTVYRKSQAIEAFKGCKLQKSPVPDQRRSPSENTAT